MRGLVFFLLALLLAAHATEAQEPSITVLYPTRYSGLQDRHAFSFRVDGGHNSAELAMYVDGTFVGVTRSEGVVDYHALTQGDHVIEARLLDAEGEATDVHTRVAVIVDQHGVMRLARELAHGDDEDLDMLVVPLLCTTLMSCRRLDLLEKTVAAYKRYMRVVEPHVSAETAVVDNGSGEEAVSLIHGFGLDSTVFFDRNRGIAHAWNVLTFGVCRAPYMLTLEDDWIAKWEWNPQFPVISMAMDVLEADDKVIEVWLQDTPWHPEYMHCNRSEWMYTPTPSRVLYRRQCTGYDESGEPLSFWGTYTNRASLKRRSTLEQIGPQRFVNGEVDYQKRVIAGKWCSAHLCLYTNPDDCINNTGMYAVQKGSVYEALFTHGDGEYRSSPGHTDFKKDVLGRNREL